MKKNLYLHVILPLLCLSPMAIASCGKSPSAHEKSSDISIAPKASLALSQTSVALLAYDSVRLQATLKNSSEPIRWMSEDPSIASVDQTGLVTAQNKEGETLVKAVAGEAEASCKITVSVDDTAPYLSLGQSSVSLAVNGTFKLSPKVSWGSHDITDSSSLSYRVKEGNDASIVAVSQQGQSFALKGASIGETVLLFTAEARGFLLTGEVSVSVHSASLVIDPVNPSLFQKGENGYILRLAKANYESYFKEIDLAFNVFEGGQKVENPSLSWSIDDGEVASLTGTKVSALKVGETLLRGTYKNGGTSAEIDIPVEVVRPRKSLSDHFSIEVENLKTYSFAEGEVSENAGDILLDGESVGAYGSSGFTLDHDKLPKSADKLGEKELLLQTDAFEYSFSAKIVTLIVDDKAEFDKMLEIAKDNGTADYFADGYFLLGSDIDYNGETTGLKNMDKTNLRSAMSKAGLSANNWGNGKLVGFRGVFDGQGHVVTGLTVSSIWNDDPSMTSLFSTLYTTGKIQNVYFVRANVTAEAAFLCSAGDGEISNVYVQYDSVGLNPAGKWGHWSKSDAGRNYSGTCFTWNGPSSVGDHAKMDHLVIDATNAKTEEHIVTEGNTQTHNVILDYHANRLLKSEAITITNDTDLLTRSNAPYKARFYSLLKESATARDYLATFDTNEWDTEGSILVPKAVQKGWSDHAITLTSETSKVHPGESFTLSCNYPGAYYSLSSSDTGVAIEGNEVTVPEDYAGNSVTVTATSRLNGEVTASLEVPVKVSLSVKKLSKVDLEESVVSGAISYGVSSVEADISEANVSGALQGVSIDGVSIAGATYANGKITLPTSSLGTAWGTKKCFASFASTDVDFSIRFVNAKITDKAGLDSLFALAKLLEPGNAKVYGGYFELGANIDYNAAFDATTVGMGTSFQYVSGKGNVRSFADDGKEGFIGTIDGCGYAIKGMSFPRSYDFGGFISVMGTAGALKNIAFTDFKSAGSGSIVGGGGGSIENVYVERTQFTGIEHRVGLFFSFNSANDLYTQPIAYRNVLVNDTYFNDNPMTGLKTYSLTGVYTKNATIENVFLATSDPQDLAYFANKSNGGVNGSSLDDLSGHAATVAEAYALADDSFRNEFDALWQTNSGVILSDGTTK